MGNKTSLKLKIEVVEVKIYDLQSEMHGIQAQIRTYLEVLKLLQENPKMQEYHNNKYKKKPKKPKKESTFVDVESKDVEPTGKEKECNNEQ